MAKPDLQLERVEIIKRKYDSRNRVTEETVEFWYPPEKTKKAIGFKT